METADGVLELVGKAAACLTFVVLGTDRLTGFGAADPGIPACLSEDILPGTRIPAESSSRIAASCCATRDDRAWTPAFWLELPPVPLLAVPALLPPTPTLPSGAMLAAGALPLSG